ncbi:putative uncharacterized protein [Lachnospiraceae bacterium CAG:364]|nr:putative uncharacterized protein [Lachnospiraceae bacterium CAG:364]
MKITKEILKRATIQGMSEYLLYGSAIEGRKQETDYDVKLEKAYRKYEEKLKEHQKKSSTELMDSANDMVSEVAEVYTAIGLEAGIKLMLEVLKHVD